MDECLLHVKNLRLEFKKKKKSLVAINGVDIQVKHGEILGVVGESGSGKSLTALSILQLIPRNAVITSGEIIYENKNLLKLGKVEMRKNRGKEISMIFQDPMVALDPVYRCGYQIIETIMQHEKDVSRKEAHVRAVTLLKQVGIPNPERCMNAYPYELSGGMCQRVMIVIALSCNPKLLIADEPTTALDVTVQAQILDLLKKLRKEIGMSILLISHDLGVMAEVADRIAIMYAGEIMEEGSVEAILNNPCHPYTKGLIMSVPRLNSNADEPLKNIPGTVPSLKAMPAGCRFNSRCAYADEQCKTRPESKQVGCSHFVRCHKAQAAEGGIANE